MWLHSAPAADACRGALADMTAAARRRTRGAGGGRMVQGRRRRRADNGAVNKAEPTASANTIKENIAPTKRNENKKKQLLT